MIRPTAALVAAMFCAALTAIAPNLVRATSPDAVSFDAVDSGWYTDDGSHFVGASAYLTGDVPFHEYRSYLGFQLAGLTVPTGQMVIRAALTLDTSGMSSPEFREEVTLFDVDADLDALYSTPSSVDTFVDLGTGVVYGRRTYSNEEAWQGSQSIELNAAAIAAIQAAAPGEFAIGARVTSLDSDPASASNHLSWEFVFGSSSRFGVRRLDVWFGVPEPSAATLLAGYALFAAAVLRRRR